MANYAKTNIGNEGRVELHETLSLTGAEISINNLPAGANVPFVHSHKTNEEIYGILAGEAVCYSSLTIKSKKRRLSTHTVSIISSLFKITS